MTDRETDPGCCRSRGEKAAFASVISTRVVSGSISHRPGPGEGKVESVAVQSDVLGSLDALTHPGGPAWLGEWEPVGPHPECVRVVARPMEWLVR